MSKMTRDDLLSLVKKVTFVVTSIEDDTSIGRDGEKIINKILTLQEPIQATSSTGVGDKGLPITIKDSKVHMNERDLEEFLEGCRKEGDVVVYEGGLHLDVSRPKVDRTTGAVRTPARIWVTSIKFNKLGNQTRTEQQKNYNTLIADMFGAGKVVDMTAGAATTTPPPTPPPPADKEGDDVDPKVVANKNGAGTGAKSAESAKVK